MQNQTAESAQSADQSSNQAGRVVALAGNPNVGKTTLFNRLTGLRQKVGNYPGVTVEHKSGVLASADGASVEILDVPGTYSLNPRSLDEEVAYRVLIGAIEGTRRPDLIVCTVDASNLERNLYLASQVLDLGIPTVIALNLVDAAESQGRAVDAEALARELGVPVYPMSASSGQGVDALATALAGPIPEPPRRRWTLPESLDASVGQLAARLGEELPELSEATRWSDALRAIASEGASFFETHHNPSFWSEVRGKRDALEADGIDPQRAEVTARYAWLTPLAERVVAEPADVRKSFSERVDDIVTHRIFGPLIFFGLLALIFQAVFAWAGPLMDMIDGSVAALGDAVGAMLPDGPVRGLIVDGVIAGVGGVIIFLPQILILFFFLGLLEDTGYMARAAFIMDRIMRRVGLSGRSVVPLVSGLACAIPGIMAARTIENPRDRLVTILVIPLMTCSARLPVYALLIAAFIPATGGVGPFGYQALTLLLMYALGIVLAVVAAAVIKGFVVRGDSSTFVMELPPYRLPRVRDVAWRMVERAKLFLRRAGTIILAVSIVLWFLATYPTAAPSPQLETARSEVESVLADGALSGAQREAAEERLAIVAEREGAYALERSAMGRLGHAIEPVIAPLGFDWKIGVALIASFAAREVAVSALGTIYSVADADETSERLIDRLRADRDPDTGEKIFTPLVAFSLMIFFVIACQCMSTVAIVKRETGGWAWPMFMLGYLTAFAWLASFVTYQGGLLLGWA